MKNYNRIKESIKKSFCFSQTEVEAAFRVYLESKDEFSSEAVSAFGGFKQLVKAAFYQHKRDLRLRLEAKETLTIDIVQDRDAESPRDWENLGTMVCFHSRYNLGDKHKLDVDEAIKLMLRKDVIALPLYLYDHGGISMSCSDFGDKWDSGQVGFIYIEKAKILKEFNVKRLSKKLLEQVVKQLKQEVKTYSQYLEGDVYGFQIKDGDGEVLDSCWGFIGYDHVTEAANEALEASKG